MRVPLTCSLARSRPPPPSPQLPGPQSVSHSLRRARKCLCVLSLSLFLWVNQGTDLSLSRARALSPSVLRCLPRPQAYFCSTRTCTRCCTRSCTLRWSLRRPREAGEDWDVPKIPLCSKQQAQDQRKEHMVQQAHRVAADMRVHSELPRLEAPIHRSQRSTGFI